MFFLSQSLSAVVTKAQLLSAADDSLLNNISVSSNIVTNGNASVIWPATQTISSYTAQTAVVETQVQSVINASTVVGLQMQSTMTLINVALQQAAAVPPLADGVTASLLTQVQQLRADFNQLLLTSAATNLNAAMLVQSTWISNMQAKYTDISQQINRLQALQRLLVTG